MKQNIKWLKYFEENYLVGKKFVSSMSAQLKPQFIDLIGCEINWEKVWLFIEPITESIEYDNLNKNTIVHSRLIYGRIKVIVDISFQFTSKAKIVTFEEGREIEEAFICKLFNFQDPENVKDLFCINNATVKPKYYEIKKIGNAQLNCEWSDIPHEGKFIIPKSKLNKIDFDKFLLQTQITWNDENPLKLESPGLIHQFSLEKETVGSYEVYYDWGSASDEFIDYLLAELNNLTDGNTLEIIAVEIE